MSSFRGALGACALLASPLLRAQTVWTGSGTDNNWSTGANWQGGVAPASATSTALQFAGTTRLAPNIDSAFTVGSLTFNSGAGAFTLSGSALTLADGGTITNNSSSTQTIANSGGVVLSGASTWNTASGDLAVSTGISGSGSFTKTGSGTLTITAPGTWSGATTISGGTVRLTGLSLSFGSPGIPTGSVITVGSGGTLLLDTNNNNSIFNNPITIQAGGTVNAPSASNTITDLALQGGTLTGARPDPNFGNFVINGNVSHTGDVTSTISATVRWAGARTFDVADGTSAIDLLVSGPLANTTSAASLTKTGAGTLALSGANTFSGGTTLNAGTLALDGASALGTGALTINGGALDNLSGGAVTLTTANAQAWNADVVFTGTNDLNLGTGAVTLGGNRTVTVNAGTLTIGGAIADGGSGYALTKAGAGTLALAGANTYTGGTTAAGGLLQIDADSRLSSGPLTLDGGGIKFGVAFNDLRTFTLGGGGATLDTNGFDVTYAQVISGAGAFTKTGAGTLTLTGANAHTGGTVVTGGLLQIDADAHLGAGAFTLDGGGLKFGAAFNDLRSVTLGSGGGSFDTNGLDVTYASVASGAGGLTKAGAGTLTLSGANTYTGGTTVAAGTVALGAGERLADTGALTVNGGTFDLGAFNETVGAVSLVSGSIVGSGTLTGSSYAVQSGSVSAPLGGTGALTKTTAGTVTLSGANAYTGGTTILAGTLALGASERLADTGALTINGGTFDLGGFNETVGAVSLVSGSITGSGTLTGSSYAVQSGTIAPALGGAGALTKTGPGTITLSGANTYAGGTTIAGGLVQIDADSRLGTGALTLDGGGIRYGSAFALRTFTFGAGGATLDTNGFNVAYGGSLGGAGAFTKTGAGTLTLSGANTYAGGTAVTGGGLKIDADARLGTGTLTLDGGGLQFSGAEPNLRAFSLGSGGGTIDTNGFNVASSGVVSGAGALTKSGAGTLTFSGANTYGGGTSLQGGTLALGSGGALGATGTIAFNGGALQFSASNTTDYSARIANSTGAIAIDTNGQSVTFASSIGSSNTGGFTKLGAGTLSLFAAGHWSGPTTVSGGTLVVTSAGIGSPSIPSGSAITVGSGGTLSLGADFNAVFGNAITIQSGGVVNAAFGAHTIGSLTLQGGTLSGASPDAVFGNFTLNGNVSQSGDTAATISTAVRWAGARTFDVADGAPAVDLLVSGSLGDSTAAGSLVKTGAGTLALRSANPLTGGITLSAGTLALGHAGALGTGTFTINGGALDNSSGGALTLTTNNAQAWNGDFSFLGANSLNLGTGAVTLGGNRTVTVNANTLTVGGAIGDGGSGYALTKAGAGTLALSGANTFSGGTTLNAGTLALGSASALGSGALTINGGTLDNLSGGALTLTTGNAQAWNADVVFTGTNSLNLGAGAVTLSGNRTVTVNANTLTVGGAVGDGGHGYSLTKAGAGTLALSGVNTYGGGTTVTGGFVQPSADASLGTGALVLNGGGLKYGAAFDDLRAFTLGSGGGTVDTNGFDVTYGPVISGAGAFSKTGAGNLTLTGVNTFTGGTTISGGALTVASGATLAAATAPLTITAGTLTFNNPAQGVGTLSGASGATINLGSGHTLTTSSASNSLFAGVLAGGGALAKAGTGTLTLSGTNTYSGGTALNGGTLALGSAGALGTSGTISFGGGTLQFGTSNATDYSARISNAANQAYVFDTNGRDVTFTTPLTSSGGTLTKNGSGLLILAVGTSYGGGTTVNGGSLGLANAGALSDTGTVTLNNNAALILGATETIGPLSGSAASSITVFNNAPLTVNETSDSTFAGTLSALTFTKTGAGTLTLSGSFDGALAVQAGKVQLGNSGNVLSDGGSVTLSTGATLALGAADEQIGPLTGTGGTIELFNGVGRTLIVNQFADGTFAGVIQGSGGELVKTGPGTLTLTGANTYGGLTLVTLGTLALGANGTLPSTGTLAVNGGTLSLGGFNQTTGTVILASGAITGTGTLTATSYDVRSGSISAVLAGAGGLTKTTTGIVTLTGTNSYTGATTISAGTLTFKTPGTLYGGNAAAWTESSLDVESGATAAFNVGGAGEFTAANIATLAALGSGSGGFKSGARLALDTTNATGGNFTVSGAIAHGLGLVKLGSGTLTLTGSNTYTGGTFINDGTLALGSAGALGATGAISFGNSGVLQFSASNTTDYSGRFAAGQTYRIDTNGQDLAFASPLASGSVAKFGAGTLTLSAAVGGIDVSKGTLVLASGSSFSGDLYLGNGSSGNVGLVFSTGSNVTTGYTDIGYGSDATVTMSGGTWNSYYDFVIGDYGNGTLNLTSGTITNDPYNGTAYLGYEGGTGTANVSGGTWNTPYYLYAGYYGAATINLTGTGTINVGGDGTGNLFLGQGMAPATLNIGTGGAAGTLHASTVYGYGLTTVNFNHTGSLTFAPQLSGQLDVTKSGAGTTILTAANNYVGTTTINAGTLLVDGSLGNTTVTVNSGGTLGGRGTIGGATTLLAGAHLAPGDSPGTITFTHGLSLAAGSALDFQLGTTSDLLRVSGGTLSGPSSGAITLNLSNSGGFTVGTYTLIDFTGAATSDFDVGDFSFGTTIPGYNYTLAFDGSTLELTATAGAIPEPSTYALLGGLACLVVALRRRKAARGSRE